MLMFRFLVEATNVTSSRFLCEATRPSAPKSTAPLDEMLLVKEDSIAIAILLSGILSDLEVKGFGVRRYK